MRSRRRFRMIEPTVRLATLALAPECRYSACLETPVDINFVSSTLGKTTRTVFRGVDHGVSNVLLSELYWNVERISRSNQYR